MHVGSLPPTFGTAATRLCHAGVRPSTGPIATNLAVNLVSTLLATWLAGKRTRTAETYRSGLESFRSFVGGASVTEGLTHLLRAGPVLANKWVTDYRTSLEAGRLAPRTVNVRIAPIRSFVAEARRSG